MEVAVVILNFNGKSYLEKFLPSVVEHSKTATIWVVDNCSTDESVDFLKANYPEIKLVINKENGGFAKGYNDGLKDICADYYVLLNSDVEVSENWIEPCIKLLASDEQIAAVQPKILAQKNKTHFEHAGAAGGYLDKNFYPFCRGRIFSEVEADEHQYDENTEVFWASGACMFIRAKLYHQFGGLDADFFAHMEEIDLCWRLKKSDYKIMACGEAKVYHVGGGTLNYMNPKKTFLNFRNSLFMIFKNYDGNLFFKLFGRLVLDGFAACIFLFKFQFAHFAAVFKSHIALYMNIKSLRQKRKLIKDKTTSFNAVGIYKRNITFKNYLGGIKHFSQLDSKDFHSKKL